MRRGEDGAGGVARSSSSAVLEELRNFIADRGYRDGDRLPPERSLAQELKASRHALQNAFRVLEAEGNIWRGVGRGTYVGRRRPSVGAGLPSITGLTNPTELMEVRLALEPQMAYLCAQRATVGEIEELRLCTERSGSAESYATYDLWDRRFHHGIADATHNRVMVAMYRSISEVRLQTPWGKARQSTLFEASRGERGEQHRAVLTAIEERDAVGARERMTEHLQTVRRHLLGEMA